MITVHEVKQFFSNSIGMKDIVEASYIIAIKIRRNRSWNIMGLSQETSIN